VDKKKLTGKKYETFSANTELIGIYPAHALLGALVQGGGAS
jgi:hypothetical protein